MRQTITQITCNVCREPIKQDMHGHGLYRGKGNSTTGDRVWLASPPYSKLEAYENHICNRCHCELVWCHPGNVNNPINGGQ